MRKLENIHELNGKKKFIFKFFKVDALRKGKQDYESWQKSLYPFVKLW